VRRHTAMVWKLQVHRKNIRPQKEYEKERYSGVRICKGKGVINYRRKTILGKLLHPLDGYSRATPSKKNGGD